MSETTGAPSGSGPTSAPGLEPPPVVAPPPVVPPFPAAPAEPLVPWLSIWTRPRATLRQILDGDPRRCVLLLAALGGVADALELVVASGAGDTLSPATALLVVAAGGAVGGILLLFILASLVTLAGRWLGGRGRMVEVIAALAWANVPAIGGLLLWLPRAALLGEETLQSMPSRVDANPPAALFFGLLLLAQALLDFWEFVITLKCIAEAHRFTAWRAFGTLVLAALLLFVPLTLLMVAAQSFR